MTRIHIRIYSALCYIENKLILPINFYLQLPACKETKQTFGVITCIKPTKKHLTDVFHYIDRLNTHLPEPIKSIFFFLIEIL